MAGNQKYNLLVDAADQLFYESTYVDTTLVKIATLSGIPLGNVYYYFKTKDNILRAVFKKRDKHLDKLFAEWNTTANARSRLKLFIEHAVNSADITAKYGCMSGSLCQELSKTPGELADLAAMLLHKIITWVQDQFMQLGKNKARAYELAEHLISNLQGLALLTVTFKDPRVTVDNSQLLYEWLEAA